MASPWEVIETMPEAAAALSWRRWLGSTFGAVAAACLEETGKAVKRIPCGCCCGCNHLVRRRGAARVAVCDCGEGCDDVPLSEDDVIGWRVSLPKFGRAVAKALNCDVNEMEFTIPRTWQVASAGDAPTPVVLTIQADRQSFRSVVGELVARLPDGFILLAPTKSLCNAASSELLAKARAGLFTLESNLSLLPDGSIEANEKGKELFARLLAENAIRDGGKITTKARYSFRLAGSVCDIVFNGSEVFHLNNTDGAKYLDYLLHHPRKVVRAFDLEVMVKPEKATVREDNSIQTTVDAQAKREARQELAALKGELEDAEANDQTAQVQRLKSEIATLEAAARNNSLLDGDTGERARDNVRKAINKVKVNLRKGNKEEKAFGVHVGQFVLLGYDVIYNQPENMSWD